MIKAACDGFILLQTFLLAALVWHQRADSDYLPWYLTALFLCAGTAAADLCHQLFRKGTEGQYRQQEGAPTVQELLLLDEQNRPVKSWSMAGRTSMVIGRRNEFVLQLNEILYEIHLKLSGGKEKLKIVYEPDVLPDNFEKKLEGCQVKGY